MTDQIEVMTIEVDRDTCAGHARCLVIAPELFDLDDESRSIVIRQPKSQLDREGALRAAQGCPERAITIRGEKWAPENP